MNEPHPQELDVLAESNRLLTSTLDLTEVIDRLADLARTRLETDVARIWLRDEAGEKPFDMTKLAAAVSAALAGAPSP